MQAGSERPWGHGLSARMGCCSPLRLGSPRSVGRLGSGGCGETAGRCRDARSSRQGGRNAGASLVEICRPCNT